MSKHIKAYNFVNRALEETLDDLFVKLDRTRHAHDFTEVDIARALDAFDLGDDWREWCEDD